MRERCLSTMLKAASQTDTETYRAAQASDYSWPQST
jgi:hypothetical protein